MSFLSILLIVLKVCFYIYLVVSVLMTFGTFSVFNEVGVILAQLRPEVYEKSKIKEFCERPILRQIFPKCFIVGFIPVLNLFGFISLVFSREDMVIELANQYIDDYNQYIDDYYRIVNEDSELSN